MGLWLSGLHERLYFARGGRSICEAKVNESEIRYYHGTLLRLNKRNKKKATGPLLQKRPNPSFCVTPKGWQSKQQMPFFLLIFLEASPDAQLSNWLLAICTMLILLCHTLLFLSVRSLVPNPATKHVGFTKNFTTLVICSCAGRTSLASNNLQRGCKTTLQGSN